MSESTDTTRPATGAAWYDQMPAWVRSLTQLGAFGLILLLFSVSDRDRSVQLRQFYEDGRQRERESQALYRESLKALWDRQERTEQTLRDAMVELRRAIDRLDAGQRQLKSDVRTIKEEGPGAFKAPTPRPKGDDPE